MDDELIEKLNTFIKLKCSRVPHNIGLDVLKIVDKHQGQTKHLKETLVKPVDVEINGKFCDVCKSGLIDYLEIHRRTCRCGVLGYSVKG